MRSKTNRLSWLSILFVPLTLPGQAHLSACDTPSLKQVLLDNVDLIDALGPLTVSGGRLNVYQAVVACVSP